MLETVQRSDDFQLRLGRFYQVVVDNGQPHVVGDDHLDSMKAVALWWARENGHVDEKELVRTLEAARPEDSDEPSAGALEALSAIDDQSRYSPVVVFRHELGHALGFRHERLQHGAPKKCSDESPFDALPLTTYDSFSVMHYLCGNAGNPSLTISETYTNGAQRINGPPFEKIRYIRN